MTIAYEPSSLLSPPTPSAGIEIPTCPSGNPASLVTFPVIVTGACAGSRTGSARNALRRSEEHTSELQSQSNLVCRLLLEKKTMSVLTFRLFDRYACQIKSFECK